MIDGIFSQNISVFFLVKTNIVFTKTKNVNNSLYFLKKRLLNIWEIQMIIAVSFQKSEDKIKHKLIKNHFLPCEIKQITFCVS